MSANYLDAPLIEESHLVDWAGWTLLRQARSNFKGSTFKSFAWESPQLKFEVSVEGRCFESEINLRSLTFAQAKCNCGQAGGSRFCLHSLIGLLELKRRMNEPEVEVVSRTDDANERIDSERVTTGGKQPEGLKTFTLDQTAEPLKLRLILPPNFELAAEKNAIMVKLEFIVNRELKIPEHLSRTQRFSLQESYLIALGMIENWTGGKAASLMSLKRDQLFELCKVLAGRPFLYRSIQSDEAVSLETLRKEIFPKLETVPEVPTTIQVKRSRSVAPKPVARPSAVERLKPFRWMEVDGSPHFLSVVFHSREDPLYERARDLLKNYQFKSEPSNGKWWLRDQHKTLNFLAEEWKNLDEIFRCGYTENFLNRMQKVQAVRISKRIEEKGEAYLLNLKIDADEAVSESSIRFALSSGKYYLISEDKIWLLPSDVLKSFEEMQKRLRGDQTAPFLPEVNLELKSAEILLAESELSDWDDELEFPQSWKEKSGALKEVGKLVKPPVTKSFFESLRTYQQIGTAWLYHLYRNDLGGILADEMGLGKTIQSIGLLEAIFEENANAVALVVAPASLLSNWKRECHRFSKVISPFVHHGNNRIGKEDDLSGKVIITSYSTLKNDLSLFIDTKFCVIIADEAQHIKNRKTKGARSLKRLQAGSRFVLTGTPVENSIDDLKSLFSFCLPGYLKNNPAGLKAEDKRWMDQLVLDKVAPYILRRNKKDVAPELPDKIEQVVWCDLDSDQQELYHNVRLLISQKMDQMAEEGADENRMRFMMLTELLRLRQVCADPTLLDDDFDFSASAKMQAFAEILEESIDGGHRILVFSQFVQLLKHLRAWLENNGIRYSYIDGKTKDRLAVCDEFNSDEEIPVCLISLKAGGTGLNLTGADTVVHFDPWWNPAVEDQATDRVHRIGQKRTVNVFKLVTTGTVEEKVLHLQQEKSNLLKDVLDASIAKTAKVNLDTLKELIQ